MEFEQARYWWMIALLVVQPTGFAAHIGVNTFPLLATAGCMYLLLAEAVDQDGP